MFRVGCHNSFARLIWLTMWWSIFLKKTKFLAFFNCYFGRFKVQLKKKIIIDNNDFKEI